MWSYECYLKVNDGRYGVDQILILDCAGGGAQEELRAGRWGGGAGRLGEELVLVRSTEESAIVSIPGAVPLALVVGQQEAHQSICGPTSKAIEIWGRGDHVSSRAIHLRERERARIEAGFGHLLLTRYFAGEHFEWILRRLGWSHWDVRKDWRGQTKMFDGL